MEPTPRCPHRRPTILTVLATVLLLVAAVAPARAEDEDARRVHQMFMPIAAGNPQPPPLDCNVPNTDYVALSIAGDPLTVDPETNPVINLGYRGYWKVNEPLRLVEYGPVWDARAPQFSGLFGDRRTPVFTTTYQTDPTPNWPVTVLGMKARRGETIFTPDSGYDIGDGYEYLVMYAGESDLTLHIGREDEFFGYVIHIDGVCTDPDLLALYRRHHAEGRRSLPALRGHQAFGVAAATEIQIAIRDSGSLMDPRSRNDWWQGR